MKRFNTTLAFLAGVLLISASGCQSTPGDSSRWSLGNLLGTDQRSGLLTPEDEAFDAFGERNPDRLLIGDWAPSRINTTLKSRFSGGENRDEAEALFVEAKQIYDGALDSWKAGDRSDELTKQFQEAANKFEIAAGQWPGSALEEDALFLRGEASFFADDYVLANRAYEILVHKYSGTRQLDLVEARRFEIAQYWLSLERNGEGFDMGNGSRPKSGLGKEARRILHRIRLDDPTGKLADDATLALGNAFFEAGQYSDAADAYEDLRKTYPGSQHQFHAHLFELKSRLAAYRGPDYDGTDLVKAEKLMKSMVRQFPQEVEAERDYLAREGSRIRELMAERDWELGQYYEGRGENRAAKFYYAKVTENFDDTSLAGEAEERIAALGGKPDVPAQKAEWLADLFPLKERNKPLIPPGDRESILR